MNQGIIDVHVHLVGATPSLENLADKIKTTEDLILLNSRYPEIYQQALIQEPIDISDAYIREMDRHGVAHALIQQRPGKATNDHVSEIVKKHPDRLSGLIRIEVDRPLSQPTDRLPGNLPSEEELAARRERAAKEIARGVEKLGLIGVGEFKIRTFTLETQPEKIARDFKPIMDTLANYKIPILIHTAWTQFPHDLYYGDPIWTDEIAYSYPEVPIVLTKMGRGLQRYFEGALCVAMRNFNVYFDTVGTTPEHLRQAIDTIGAHRIMFGTDWSPTWRWVSEPADVYTMRKKVLDKAGLSSSEREQIEWRTAIEVYKLKL